MRRTHVPHLQTVLALVFGAWLLVLGPSSSREAFAADSTSDEARAVQLFEESSKAYEAGRFAEAIDLLKKAWALKKEPVLLYNLGRAYEGVGNLEEAAKAYSDFLEASPNVPDRGAVTQRISSLRRQIEEKKALERQRVEAEREKRAAEARAEQSRHRPSIVPWIVAGVGVLGIGAGAYSGALSNDRHDEAMNEPSYLFAKERQESAETAATVANVLFIVGGALVVAGVVWGVLDRRSSR